ncbi:MAG: hypothetical protein AMJ46_12550 [Latescibacteria bacterium DG_63]|nr:MAG: hypothetical protein AMJ46_12550 [Latescibacteria bacterium DG_63]
MRHRGNRSGSPNPNIARWNRSSIVGPAHTARRFTHGRRRLIRRFQSRWDGVIARRLCCIKEDLPVSFHPYHPHAKNQYPREFNQKACLILIVHAYSYGVISANVPRGEKYILS